MFGGSNTSSPDIWKSLGWYHDHSVTSHPDDPIWATAIWLTSNCLRIFGLQNETSRTCAFLWPHSWAPPKKYTSDTFPWNTGCLIGMLMMIYYNPHKNGSIFIAQLDLHFFNPVWDTQMRTMCVLSTIHFLVNNGHMNIWQVYGKCRKIHSYIHGASGVWLFARTISDN